METRIENIYYFNYRKDIGYYDSFRNFQSTKIKYLGLALSTPKMRINASPTEYMISLGGSNAIKAHVDAYMPLLNEVPNETAVNSPEYIMICYADGTKRYFEHDPKFCEIFKLGEQHKVEANSSAEEYVSPYAIQKDPDICVPSTQMPITPSHASGKPPQPTATSNNIQSNVLSMKWFTFFTKVRPWITIIVTALALLGNAENFILLLDYARFGAALFAVNLVYLVGSLVTVVFQILLLGKAKFRNEKLLNFIRTILLYDVFFMVYGYAVSQFYQGTEVVVLAIVSILGLVLGYFIWYRCNMKYFRKRLTGIVSYGNTQQPAPTQKVSSKQKLPIIILSILVVVLAAALIVVSTNNNPNGDQTSQSTPTPNATAPTPTPSQPYYKELGLTANEYKIAKIVAYDVDEYCEHMAKLREMVSKATYSDELKQEKVVEYLNNQEYLEYGERIILYRYIFLYDTEYCSDIVDYLNERDDVTYEEEVFVLEELGFAVFDDGTVKW